MDYKYDLFISYRRDGGKEIARPLKSELERRGFRVFLDFDELKDGVFDRRIMDAIDSSPIFLVILSPHALDRCADPSDWVRREIEYALQRGCHIVPVNPDLSFEGFPAACPETLREGLGIHQFSEVMLGQLFMASIDKLVQDRILPRLRPAAERAPAAARKLKIMANADCRILIDGQERGHAAAGRLCTIPLPAGEYWFEAVGTAGDTQADIARALKIGDCDRLEQLKFEFKPVYRIGDLYEENGRRGIVFEVDSTGRHGKILSMRDAWKSWCIDEESEKRAGADDDCDGMKNLQVVMRIPDWQKKYPAFAWCTRQGEGWYLPSRREWEVFANQKVYDMVCAALKQHGGDHLSENDDYLSSSEFNEFGDKYNATMVYVFSFRYRDNAARPGLKFAKKWVRPISVF